MSYITMIKHTLLILFVGIHFICSAQVNFKSSNLPIIVINTHGQTIVDDPKITADMGIINNEAGNINNLTDPFNDYNGKIGIEIRGSSSQSFPKKQYGIELDDDNGNSIDASLLGMPAKDDWILFAAYDDKTLLRDALAYHLGRAQGRYASRQRFCEVVINNVYQGVYVLFEKIKRDKNRVNISKLNSDDVSGDDVTGGYIIKIDKASGSGGDGWISSHAPLNRSGNQTVYFLYDYPKQEDIVTEQKNYIQQYVGAFEAALAGNNFKDPDQGYAKYIDVDSFIDFYLMMEVTKNPDGYRLSTFMYKDKDSKGGKLCMGPIWDFNEGFGNVDYCTQGNPEGFVVTNFNNVCNTDYWLIPFWWNRLFQDSSFVHKVHDRWVELRSGSFKTGTILSYVDSVTNVLSIDSAQQRNFIQWPILGQYVWPNYYVGQSYVAEINWIKSWITQRMNWLDDNIKLPIITSVEEPTVDLKIKTYPNPFSSTINISYSVDSPLETNFELFNMIGMRVDKFSKTQLNPGTYQFDYTLNAPPGTYLLRVQSGNKIRYSKIVKIY